MKGSGRLPLLFALLLLLPAAAVVWLGVQLLRQDRDIAQRQRAERREIAVDWFGATLEQALSATQRQLGSPSLAKVARQGDDAVTVRMGPAGRLEAWPPAHLLFYPAIEPAAVPAPVSIELEQAESLEYRDGNYSRAADAFRALSSSPNRSTRAGALLRLARNLRRLGLDEAALAAYESLEDLHDQRLAGLPADLVARRARCALLETMGRREALGREAETLLRDLSAPRWRLDRATLASYRAQVWRWLGREALEHDPRELLAAATESIWAQHAAGTLTAEGRQVFRSANGEAVVLWRSQDGITSTLIAGPVFQRREWIQPAAMQLRQRGMQGDVVNAQEVDARRRPIVQDASASTRSAAEIGLPWPIAVTEHGAGPPEPLPRRNLMMLAGLGLLLTLVAGGGYLVTRALSRELTVARLQSDFVSAVSHEFRTPLTSLHQFTTLLNEDDTLPAEKRRTFYEAQARATERLRRLVESLLDFGRMEAGARPYRFRPVAIDRLVADVVGDWQRDAPEFDIVFRPAGEEILVSADGDALGRALSNLVDNGIKYSGDERRVEVDVSREPSTVAITVRDFGLGVPRREQSAIFEKFVRGAASSTHQIKGTGIGLAMVRHIVRAHRGSISVKSAEGEGSTFTMRVPLVEGEGARALTPERRGLWRWRPSRGNRGA